MSEQNTTPPGAATATRSWPRIVTALALLLGILAGLAFVLFDGSSGSRGSGGGRPANAASRLFGTLALPARQAPAIDLRDYLGRPVTLAQYRGKAVLVTFIYTHCPDICPLMVSNLRVALHLLGAEASHAQVIAVSVDQRGDTRATVARFLRARGMLGRMRYLIGSTRELARTWSAWSVGSIRVAGHPDAIEHSALVYGVSASGTLTTLYPSSFEPSEIVHDVPRLATR